MYHLNESKIEHFEIKYAQRDNHQLSHLIIRLDKCLLDIHYTANLGIMKDDFVISQTDSKETIKLPPITGWSKFIKFLRRDYNIPTDILPLTLWKQLLTN